MQEGIKPYREHAAIILHESALNEIKGTPEYEVEKSNSDADNSDVMIVEDPKRLDLANGVEDKHLTPVNIMPIDQRELLYGLCKQIMAIQDANCLE